MRKMNPSGSHRTKSRWLALVAIGLVGIASAAKGSETLTCTFPKATHTYDVVGHELRLHVGGHARQPAGAMRILRNDPGGIVAAMDAPSHHGVGIGVFLYDRLTGKVEWRSGGIGQRVWLAEQGTCSVRSHI